MDDTASTNEVSTLSLRHMPHKTPHRERRGLCLGKVLLFTPVNGLTDASRDTPVQPVMPSRSPKSSWRSLVSVEVITTHPLSEKRKPSSPSIPYRSSNLCPTDTHLLPTTTPCTTKCQFHRRSFRNSNRRCCNITHSTLRILLCHRHSGLRAAPNRPSCSRQPPPFLTFWLFRPTTNTIYSITPFINSKPNITRCLLYNITITTSSINNSSTFTSSPSISCSNPT
jgi:hypothetical protein